MSQIDIELKHFFISEGHNYIGHHEQPAGTHEIIETNELNCIAGKGIKGDRFFEHEENHKGQITFFSYDLYLEIQTNLKPEGFSPSAFRRNVLISGVDLNSLVKKEFMIQSILFEGSEECSPCYWMDQAVTKGTEDYLKGQGGLRARILNDGILSLGHSALEVF